MVSSQRILKVVAHPENCKGCLLCQLRCSLEYTGLFNPLKARLVIQRPITGGQEISFTDECNDCGLCARVCPYEAIILEEEGSN